MDYLVNAWYVAGFADELEQGKPLARTLLGQPVVFFRNESGGVTALADRCAHRFAPLSAGKVSAHGRAIECPYHGLQFGADGKCTHNPHTDGAIAKSAAVTAYCAVERDRLVWWWAGDAAAADHSLIPDFSDITQAPDDATIRGYMPTACRYDLLVDNILDLTHADYLHAGSLGSGAITRCKPTVEAVSNRSIRVQWVSSGDKAPAAFDAFLGGLGRPTDQWTEVVWTAPSCMHLRVGATLLGQPRDQGVDTSNLHLATPESETTCHYWFWSTRDFAISPQANAHIRSMVEFAFTQQDKPMLEAQQRRIGSADFWSLKPVLLQGDAGAVRVRRALDKLIAAERAAT